jgi:hypothetical protein
MSKDFNDTFNFIKKNVYKKEESKGNLYVVPKAELVDKFLNSESNNHIVSEYLNETKEKYTFELNPVISDKEVEELLSSLKNKYDSERLILLVDECKSTVIDSIIKPFGLAGVLFEDHVGGNVDTIHNVRNTDKRYNNGQGIYVTEENKESYEERPKYDYIKYHDKNQNYKKHKENIEELKKANQTITDDYTKLEIGNDDIVSIEHIISASDISNDPAVSLARANGAELANDDNNLCYINGQLNSSINSDSPSEYIDRMKSLKNPEARQNMLSYLNNKTKPLTPEEEKAKKLLEQKNAIVENEEEVRQLENNAKENIDKKLYTKYYTSKEFVSNVGKTSASEGIKMGAQQAIGLLVREFALAAFSEAKDIFSNRHNIRLNSEFFHSLKVRFERISRCVMSKWKDVVAAFGHGAISGFFSNLITIIINTFLTTSKRAVRMIREGFYSLLKALKILMSPPQNMSREEAAHEATKLIASGLIVTGGIAIEELLQKSLASIPVIGMFSDIIATVIMGIATGLSMAFIVYLIDKIDLFKVNENRCQENISYELNEMVDADLEEYENAYNFIACTLGI